MLADTGKTAHQHIECTIPVCLTAYLYWKGGKATSPPEESEKGNPRPEGSRTPRTDALHQGWSLRMGLVMREVKCKSSGRRVMKIKKCKPVYIPSPERRNDLGGILVDEREPADKNLQ